MFRSRILPKRAVSGKVTGAGRELYQGVIAHRIKRTRPHHPTMTLLVPHFQRELITVNIVKMRECWVERKVLEVYLQMMVTPETCLIDTHCGSFRSI